MCYVKRNLQTESARACFRGLIGPWIPVSQANARALFAARLKAARLAAGLTQQALGIEAGIPEDVARTRINRYERAVHDADQATAQRIAKALDTPVAALYADSEEMAQAIKAFAALSQAEQRAVADELVERADSARKRRKSKR